jgi:hypothetical protein
VWVDRVSASVGGRIAPQRHKTDGRAASTPHVFSGRAADGKAIISTHHYHSVETAYYPPESRVLLLGADNEKVWYRIESLDDYRIVLVRE